MKMNEIYEAPELEVLNVTIEKGFQMSGYDVDGTEPLPED